MNENEAFNFLLHTVKLVEVSNVFVSHGITRYIATKISIHHVGIEFDIYSIHNRPRQRILFQIYFKKNKRSRCRVVGSRCRGIAL